MMVSSLALWHNSAYLHKSITWLLTILIMRGPFDIRRSRFGSVRFGLHSHNRHNKPRKPDCLEFHTPLVYIYLICAVLTRLQCSPVINFGAVTAVHLHYTGIACIYICTSYIAYITRGYLQKSGKCNTKKLFKFGKPNNGPQLSLFSLFRLPFESAFVLRTKLYSNASTLCVSSVLNSTHCGNNKGCSTSVFTSFSIYLRIRAETQVGEKPEFKSIWIIQTKLNIYYLNLSNN